MQAAIDNLNVSHQILLRRLLMMRRELTSYWYIRLSSPMYTHLQQDSLGAWLAARLECSSAVMVLVSVIDPGFGNVTDI